MLLFVKRAKFWIKVLLGQNLYFPRQVHVKTISVGDPTWEFPVLASPPQENSGISGGTLIVYSFGIGEDLSFSQGILDAFPQARVYAFDPTPKAIHYAEKHPLSRDSRFTFLPYGISDTCGKQTFYLPKNEDYVSGSMVQYDGVSEEKQISVEMRTLGALMEQLGHQHIDILKLDIEGSEFQVIPQILESGCVVPQLCVEQHFCFFPDGKEKMRALVKLLNQHGYYIAEMHKNSEGFLFVKKDLCVPSNT